MSHAWCLLAALLLAAASGQQVPHTVHFERAGGVQSLNVTTVRLLAFCSFDSNFAWILNSQPHLRAHCTRVLLLLHHCSR